MEYDYRNRAGPSPYEPHVPAYRPPSSSTAPLYPRPGQPFTPPYHHHNPPTSSSPGNGIRVAVMPGYQITLPPQLSTHVGETHPRSNFHFDFGLERKVLAEAEKRNPNWSHLVPENIPSRPAEAVPSTPSVNPIMGKYIASGLNREAVTLAIAHYGDSPTKVQEFVKGYTLLREMGFSSNKVAEALFTYDSDSEKALAYFLNNLS